MTTTQNYSILSNGVIENGEVLDEKKKKILDGIKMDLLESLTMDERIVNRNQLANDLMKLRKEKGTNHEENRLVDGQWIVNPGLPLGEIVLRNEDKKVIINLAEDKNQKKYREMIEEYSKALCINKDNPNDPVREKKLKELDSRFAEMLILDEGLFIEFKDGDDFETGSADSESQEAYKGLNKGKYKNKIERVKKAGENGDFYIIKWEPKVLKEIKKRFEEEVKKSEAPEKPEKPDKPEGETLISEDASGDNEKNNEELEGLRKKQEELEEQLRKNGEDNESLRKDNEELKKAIKDLIDKLNEKENSSHEKDEDKDKEEKNDKNEDEETHDENIDDDFFKDLDDIDADEILDENPNYILRSVIVEQVVRIRGSKGYPQGTIEIRGESINIEEFEFYEELKEEYINAKGDAEKLAQLDKEFAELVILFSPRGAEFKDRYYIKLTEDELKDGLVVTSERLAKYGISISTTEYFEKIVEREVIRERRIVKKIETIITELQTTIIELTRTIDIDKSSKEVILLEIKKKRELLMILLRRQRKLLLLLTGNKNSEELKKLRDQEANLQKEYDALLAEKKKQEEIKKEIADIKKRIAELGKDDEKTKILDEIESKKGIIEGIKKDIKKLEERKSFINGQLKLNDLGLSAERIAGYKSELEEIDKTIKQLKDDIKKINKDIKALEDKLQKRDAEKGKKKNEFKIKLKADEILAKSTEIGNLREKLEKLEKEQEQLISEDKKRELDKPIKELKEKIAKLEAEREQLNKELAELQKEDGEDGKEPEELKNLRKKLKELEAQLAGMDQDIDSKLKKKEKELEAIRKQIKEKEQAGGNNEIQAQLIVLIEEQESLLRELETLESILISAKTEEEKIRIREQIKIINKRLTIISKKITVYEHEIKIFKEKVTSRRYRLYQATELKDNPTPTEGLKLNSVISDMGTDVFEEKAALKVEEELKQEYKNLGTWDVFGRLALYLGRGRKRRRMINREKNNMANTAFQTDPNYSALNEQSQNAADRHAHELATGMVAINRITTVQNPQVDQLCKDYLDGQINDATFQTQFNAIVAADANIQNALNGQNITHIGSNILLRLKEQLALNTLINNLDTELSQYIATGSQAHMHNMENLVERYIRDYQKTPAFMASFEKVVGGDANEKLVLRRYLAQQKAVMKMQIKNLTMSIDIINKGKSAYQIDNSDREKGWKYKVGKFMDKHPWGTAIGSIALGLGLGAATAGVGAVAGAAFTTGVFGAYAGTTSAIKKWTHHTKEQNTHEKNVVTDYRNEQAKIQQWQNDALNGSWWRKYKAKRQLALYDQTTQENIRLTNQITEYITNLSSKVGELSEQEKNFMRCNLIEGWARLKYYREMGHNFLASENVDTTEKDMMRLEKAITLGCQKIGETTNSIETTMTATNSLGTNITYDVLRNDLKASYDKSLIQFKRERRNLALKYGIGTAAVSIGTALGLQYITGTGVFAKGTPATPPTSTSHSGGTDNFDLGKDNVLLPTETGYVANPAGIHDQTVSAITGAPSGSTVTFTYGVGTDATPVIPGHLTLTDVGTKVGDVSSNISAMSGLSASQKSAFLSELSSLSHSGFTNNNLATMRAAEYLEHCAQAMSDVGDTSLIPAFSRTLDVSGGTYNSLAERFMTGAIDITTPGKPGTDPVKWGRWLMGVPLFFNTFKDRKGTDDTTDQKWNNQNAQQQQQPNNP